MNIAAAARENAEIRWAFAKTFVEPRIQEASNDQTATGLLPNHEALIRSSVRAQCIVKCRKTAHSWGIALDALARAATEPRSTSIIQSYDEKEARDKNNFINWIYGVLPDVLKAELRISEGSEERRFSNGSRIQFIASKAPTGAGATIYVDEFSVESKSGAAPEEILVAAIGATTHGGCIRIGGTQRGPETLFNKIVTGEVGEAMENAGIEGLPDVEWEVCQFPWWMSPALCIDVPTAAIEAPNMPTQERVIKFGNDKLKIQYVTYCRTPLVGEELFKREFEMYTLDDKESYFTQDLVRSCIAPPFTLTGRKYWFARELVSGEKLTIPQQKGEVPIPEVVSICNRIIAAMRTGEFRGTLGAGMDVALDKDKAVIVIANADPNRIERIQLRATIVLQGTPMPALRWAWYYVLDHLPVTRGVADATKGSVGRGLGQEANLKYGPRSLPFEFTPSNRKIAIAAMKSRMENAGLELPPETRDGSLEKEFMAIKKQEVGDFDIKFIAPRTEKGHCDTFFALVMLGTIFDQPQITNVSVVTGTIERPGFGSHGRTLPAGAGTRFNSRPILMPGRRH